MAVLLNALVCADPAAAQCGPGTDNTNTACGSGALANNTGSDNSAFGFDALNGVGVGGMNTALGVAALNVNTGGIENTAVGMQALSFNTTGYANVAVGVDALSENTSGFTNTVTGVSAMDFNTTGGNNTADGFEALRLNTSGFYNIGIGYGAGYGITTGVHDIGVGEYTYGFNLTTGTYNTALGPFALAVLTSGSNNVAMGAGAAQNDATGSNNVAEGVQALYSNKTGNSNVAVGNSALRTATGSNNTALGNKAGFAVTSGGQNIEIGNPGAVADANTIRIGTAGTQTRTFIAGVSGILSGASESTELAVNRTTGQVGVIPSSARFKRDIHDMGGASTDLMKLRPVTFRYKDDPIATLQYGLVAEEVARVYPNLVVHDTDGKVQSVRYLELTALLLNELQKQTKETHQLVDALKQKDASINALSERLATLEQEVRTANADGLRSLARK